MNCAISLRVVNHPLTNNFAVFLVGMGPFREMVSWSGDLILLCTGAPPIKPSLQAH